MASEPFISYNPSVLEKKEKEAESSSTKKAYSENENNEALLRKKSSSISKSAYRKKKSSTIIVNVAAGLDGCDDQLLPSSFRALEVELNFHPAMLGQITLVQTLCLSIGSPIWGYLSDKHSRKWILTCGAFVWGAATIGLAWVSDISQVMLLRALNGFALGCVGPISQSILADTTNETNLGFAFGLVQLSACIGRLLGGVVTTSVAFLPVGNILAWRLCFLVVGCLSICLSLVAAVFMSEAPRPRQVKATMIPSENGLRDVSKLGYFEQFKVFVSESLLVPSVIVVTAEGLLGTIPWSAFSFNTMYFQYCGMSDVQAAFITGSLLVGAAFGGVIGGRLGDIMHKWSKNYGRPLIGQMAIFGRVPLVILAYTFIPKHSDYFLAYFVVALLIGLSSIAGIAVNRPILADVVRPDQRGKVFSIIVAAEGSVAALLGAPLVGILAETFFGYRQTTQPIDEMEFGIRNGNAVALAQALQYQTAIPWAISFFLYGLLHFTYGHDLRKMKEIVEEEFEAISQNSESSEE
ncbi:transporter, major facilitator family protein [Cardiosporidium cionae]|uniref:Transporter, major facilitator family protein n=1 Tax=Cardiosporidium cionae TaxID=476202 RepID=A0ABQ7JC15_9APIC|nr:transporter, major facilitator family protein [Cardiosporidium cionae]|eukprot:KAF8821548.1 transporter, major facilitator family protein [Cardiosporidium cionae]